MTPNQIDLVQKSWGLALPNGDAAMQMFFERLFFLDPSLKPLFKADLRLHGRKVLAMMTLTVDGLRQPDRLLPAVQALGKRHAGYGVRDEHYDTVGAALLWTLEQGLADSFTSAVRDAWTAAFHVLSRTMKDAAKVPA